MVSKTVTRDFQLSPYNGSVYAIAIQNDGKIFFLKERIILGPR
jgi:hypothetical protein